MAKNILKTSNEHITTVVKEEKMVSVHEGKNAFKCEICEKIFSQKGNMNKHIALIHEGKNAFKCEMCEKAFLQRVACINTLHRYMKERRHSNVKCVTKTFLKKVA